jgi:hypothetical protein
MLGQQADRGLGVSTGQAQVGIVGTAAGLGGAERDNQDQQPRGQDYAPVREAPAG